MDSARSSQQISLKKPIAVAVANALAIGGAVYYSGAELGLVVMGVGAVVAGSTIGIAVLQHLQKRGVNLEGMLDG